MTDLVTALRDRAYSFKSRDELCEAAADEIERLLTVIDSYCHSSAAACREINQLKEVAALTDDEREAIERVAKHCADTSCVDTAKTLWGFLQRLGY